MANTRDILGDETTLNGLIENTLETFEEDGVFSLGRDIFYYNVGLKKVIFPNVSYVDQRALYNCKNLEEVDLSAVTSIGPQAFDSCSKLKHLLLRASSKAVLSSINVFSSTLIGIGEGAIYVPSDLLSAYKSDDNWKNFYITTLDNYPATDYSTIEDSWDTILTKINAGTAYSEYGQGATKSFTWSDGTNNGTAYAQLIAVGKDELVDGGDNSKLTTWIIKNAAFEDKMNATSTNSNGWGACALRTKLQGMLSNFDNFFQTNIKAVKKTYYDKETASTLSTGTSSDLGDKLWIPSVLEMFGGSSYENSGCTYSDFFKSDSERIKSYNGAADSYWLRSASGANKTGFRYVLSSGSGSSNNANNYNSVVLGFCI